MRLADWSALGAVALLGVGLTPIVFVQIELAAPRVQIFEDQLQLFGAAIVVHGLIMAACLPLAVAALGFAITGEARNSPLWTSVSVLLLGFSLLSAIAFLAMTAFGVMIGSDLADLAGIPSTLILLLSAILVAATFGAARAAPLFFSIPVLAGAAYLMLVRYNAGADALLGDSYFSLAPTHALGVAVILLTLAISSAYVGRNTDRPGNWFGVLVGVSILAAGVRSVWLTASLGLSAAARRYFDYPDIFAARYLELSIASLVLALLALAALGYLAFLLKRGGGQASAAE
ncbi:MAG: hypothetical protein R3C16_05010 [Hyphomonadaceae bacterium]